MTTNRTVYWSTVHPPSHFSCLSLYTYTHTCMCVSEKDHLPKKNKKTQNIILAVPVLTVQDPKSETGREHHYPSVLQAFGSCSFSVCVSFGGISKVLISSSVRWLLLVIITINPLSKTQYLVKTIMASLSFCSPPNNQGFFFFYHRSRPVLHIFLHIL